MVETARMETMMTRLSALAMMTALAMISGCNVPRCPRLDIVDRNGVVACFEAGAPLAPSDEQTVSQEDMEKMDTWLKMELVGLMPEYYSMKAIEDCLPQVTVIFHTDGDFRCSESSTGWCAGLQSDTVLQVSARKGDCAWKTSYRHELTHWLERCVRGITDENHLEPEFQFVESIQNGMCP